MRFDFLSNDFREKQVNPHKIAIIGSDRKLTWDEFEDAVNLLIIELKELNISTGCPIIVYGHKEAYYPVVMLACIILNIPYIPIDTIYPIGRLENIRKQSGSEVIINLSSLEFKTFSIEIGRDLRVKKRQAFLNEISKIRIDQNDPLSYIIFTSGTTGDPKGVMIQRKSLNSFVDWLVEDHCFTSDDVFLSQALFSFDVSLYGFLGALSLGSTVYLLDRETAKNGVKLLEEINKYGCSSWISTPSFVYLFLREKEFCGKEMPSMKKFLFAGETLLRKTTLQIHEKFPDSRIFNAYGPTEATITTTLVEITPEITKRYQNLPIGYVKKGAEIILIEETCGDEKIGELVILGDHVSSGYLNNERLTKEKFLVIKGKPAFKTGDLGYYEDDLLFCLGRNDYQIKLNGYRVELNDISNNIEGISEISKAVTIPLKRNGEVKRLASFVLINKGIDQESVVCQESIQNHLKKFLPDYMIPGIIKIVDKIPLNANGKVDESELLKLL